MNQRFMEEITSLINNALKTIPELHRLSSSKKRLFSSDLAFVALSVRTGYLVDVISTDDPISIFSNLLSILRRKSPLFGLVVHVFDPTSHQSFFANRMLTLRRFHSLTEIHFISLPSNDSYQLLQDVPSGVQEVLLQLAGQCDRRSTPLSISLSVCTSSSSVPVAAVLLDYPVAYVPDAAVASFLHLIPLDVYECILKVGSHRHSLLKFSCPAPSGENKLAPECIRTNLENHFGSESRLGRWEEVELEVTHRIETHDRVAL